MKVVIVFFALVAFALAAPQKSDKEAEIVKYESDNIGVDGYKYSVETSNGISSQEQGSVAKVGDEEAIQVQGQFTYKAPDGQVFTVTYVADQNGFQPQGEHLPQPPQ